MPVVIYTFDRSPVCRAVMLTVKAIGLKVDYKVIDLAAGEQKSEAYLKINPAGTVPFLDDNGLRIWESRAINQYLVDQYSKDDSLYPKNLKARAKVDNMLFFDSGSLSSNISEYFYPQLFLGKPADPAREAIVRSKLQLLNRTLHENKFVAGDQLTIADFSIISNLVSLQAVHFNFDPYPDVTSWMARVKTKVPFYEEVTKKGTDAIFQMASERLRK